MKIRITATLIGAFIATLAAPLISSAAIVTYTPEFNLDDAAVPASIPIAANTVTPVNSAIVDGTTSTSYAFTDAATGLSFSYDLNYSGTVDQQDGNRLELRPAPAVAVSESITIAFGAITVDTSGYISGSIGGITGPVNASVTSAGFNYFLAESFSNSGTINPYNILTIDDGTGSLTSYTTDPLAAGSAPAGATVIDLTPGNQVITLAATTINEITFTATQDINGAVRPSDLGSTIELEVTAIPEPATLGMVALFGGGVLFIRRRFMM
ncbi:PEP-CTERM sorting domain-containing protein [Pontiellaceae bacterium B12227]|nr:PEP-CTERM sorting domain-containing protein [Pontiellaceae bacterium B12227]